jgi:hypothetical protein
MKITRSATSPTGALEAGINLYLSLEEAKRIRAALSEFDAEELTAYGDILEKLRLAIPKQWG